MVPGNFYLNAGDNEFPMVFPEGSWKGLLVWVDTSFEDKANGILGEHPQKLRIAMLNAAGSTVEPARHEAVGRAPGDPKPWPRLDIKFKNAAKTGEINITREDAGTKRIAFCLY